MRDKSLLKRICLVFAGLAILLALSCQEKPVATDKPTVKIGYMICNSEEETLQRFRPLTAYLSREMGVNFEAVAIDTMKFQAKIDEMDFTHTNSLLYVILHRYNGVEIIAVENRGELKNRSRGLVVSRKNSGINNLADLKGKRMIFGPMLAPTAFMSQVYALQEKGFDIDRDLRSYNFPSGPYKHEKLIYAVKFGKYDAGAFPYYDFEIMAKQGKVDWNNYNILAQGPLVPYCNFGVNQKVDAKLAKKFKKTLLNIKATDTVEIDGERVNILKLAQVQGFVTAEDSDFDIIRTMAKATNMPPYQEY